MRGQGGKIMNIREEDIPEVREESFRYPGTAAPDAGVRDHLAWPIPSRARRAAWKRSPRRRSISSIDDIMEKRLMDGQLKECDLTMREIEVVGGELQAHTPQHDAHPRGLPERAEGVDLRQTPGVGSEAASRIPIPTISAETGVRSPPYRSRDNS